MVTAAPSRRSGSTRRTRATRPPAPGATERLVAPCGNAARVARVGPHVTALEELMAFRGPLRRSRSNRVIAGVVGGLAAWLDIDPMLARVLYVIVSVLSAAFPGVLVYVLLWIAVPEE